MKIDEKEQQPGGCPAPGEVGQAEEFFCRFWVEKGLPVVLEEAERSYAAKPLPGSVVIHDLVRLAGWVQIEFFNFEAPFQGSHFAEYNSDKGVLELKIGNRAFIVEGYVFKGKRRLHCERPNGPGPLPEGWDAEEEDGGLAVVVSGPGR